MDLVVRRMARLFKHNYNLDTAYVDALLGPFAMWVIADYRGSSEAASMTKKIMTHSGADDAVHRAAARRMADLWCVVTKQEAARPSPKASGIMYKLGLLMDAHVPLLLCTDTLEMHQVYDRCLAPEQISIMRVCNDHYYPMSTVNIERIWLQYIGQAPLKSLTKLKVSSRKQTRRKRPPRGKKRKVSASGAVFEMPPAPVESAITLTVNQHLADYLKIVDKGMPRSPTARSVKDLLRKAVHHFPNENCAVVDLVRKFVLGAYQYAKTIAPPYARLLAYGPSTDPLMSAIEGYANPSLFAMIAEYVIGMARKVPVLHMYLERDLDWQDYVEQAYTACNNTLRPMLYTSKHVYQVPKIRVGFQQPLTTRLVMRVLAAELSIRAKLRSVDIRAALKVQPSLAKVYRIFKTQHNTNVIYAEILRQIGVIDIDIQTLERTFQSLCPDHISVQIRDMLSKMSPGGRALFKLYVHHLIHAATFAVIPKQRAPIYSTKMRPYAVVCVDCYTIRSQVYGVNLNQRSKDGIEIDTLHFSVACTSCTSKNTRLVNLETNRVVGYNVNDMTTPNVVGMCCMCSRVTAYSNVVDTHEICDVCYGTAIQRTEPRRCICGLEFTAKNKACGTFTAMNGSGGMSLYALCRRHKYILDMASSSVHPIAFYKHFLEK